MQPADLVTEEVLNGKLHFLCSDSDQVLSLIVFYQLRNFKWFITTMETNFRVLKH